MAQPPRIEYERACYDVMNRGKGLQGVFHGDVDLSPESINGGNPRSQGRDSLGAIQELLHAQPRRGERRPGAPGDPLEDDRGPDPCARLHLEWKPSATPRSTSPIAASALPRGC